MPSALQVNSLDGAAFIGRKAEAPVNGAHPDNWQWVLWMSDTGLLKEKVGRAVP